jgi:hypothetical protein
LTLGKDGRQLVRRRFDSEPWLNGRLAAHQFSGMLHRRWLSSFRFIAFGELDRLSASRREWLSGWLCGASDLRRWSFDRGPLRLDGGI